MTNQKFEWELRDDATEHSSFPAQWMITRATVSSIVIDTLGRDVFNVGQVLQLTRPAVNVWPNEKDAITSHYTTSR